MSKQCDNKIYIVREIMLCDDYGSIRIDEEAIFLSFKKALSFIEMLVDTDAIERDLLILRIELTELLVNKEESCEIINRWVYTIDGKLLEKKDGGQSVSEIQSFKGKHKIGDIVCIKPKLIEPSSSSVKGDFAVISDVPVTQKKLLRQASELLDSDFMYTVHYITDNGLINHKHFYEQALSVLEQNLPEELNFLRIYSKHLKRDIQLSKEVLEK